jgi:protein-S-isoprenylcysteine O-methyltransferase Ste14
MPEKQKDHPEISPYIHPPIVALFYIIVAYLLGVFIPLPLVVPSLIKNLGLGLILIGLFLGFAAFSQFSKAKTTLDPHGSVNQVVTSGIYRFTRNPIYLGFLCMVIGFSLYSKNYWGILIAPLFVFTLNRLVIEKEEAYLEEKFKEQYTDYKSRVRRWL